MAVLILIATPWAVTHVEDRLEREAAEKLVAAGIDTGPLNIDFDYRDGGVTGAVIVCTGDNGGGERQRRARIRTGFCDRRSR
ncbi:MAG: hypothetical protein ACI8Y4_001282 [Candidatus Poriferisodalaceae bacterium]|jgi:hypothetical protein